jgi:hypothetical protein
VSWVVLYNFGKTQIAGWEFPKAIQNIDPDMHNIDSTVADIPINISTL